MEVFLTMCDYWLWFVAYSIAGWIYEMIIFRITEGKFVRRGFCTDPSARFTGQVPCCFG